jgi:hypothetical protein
MSGKDRTRLRWLWLSWLLGLFLLGEFCFQFSQITPTRVRAFTNKRRLLCGQGQGVFFVTRTPKVSGRFQLGEVEVIEAEAF